MVVLFKKNFYFEVYLFHNVLLVSSVKQSDSVICVCVCVYTYIGLYVEKNMRKNIYVCVYMKMKVLVIQSCPTLCDSMDCSLPVSSVLGIFQARIMEWVAISFSRRSPQPRD